MKSKSLVFLSILISFNTIVLSHPSKNASRLKSIKKYALSATIGAALGTAAGLASVYAEDRIPLPISWLLCSNLAKGFLVSYLCCKLESSQKVDTRRIITYSKYFDWIAYLAGKHHFISSGRQSVPFYNLFNDPIIQEVSYEDRHSEESILDLIY